MVILLRHVCIQRNDQSRRTFVAWIFIMYHSVRNDREWVRIHVNNQTIVAFSGQIGVYTYDVFTWVYYNLHVRLTLRGQLTTLLGPLRPTGGTVSERCCISVVVQ